MNIIVAADSYKGSLSSIEVGKAIRRGMQQALPAASISVIPMADGGEGTLDAFQFLFKGETISFSCLDPRGKQHQATYGLIKEKKLAIIESALIVGLTHLKKSSTSPLETTSFGVGQCLLHAIDHGAEEIIIGLGGSGTNDGGIGLLEALGAKFYSKGSQLTHVKARHLDEIDQIDLTTLDPRVKTCTITIAADVENPLFGDHGATAVFGPQKGVTPELHDILEKGMINYASVIDPSASFSSLKGAGAAGGLGFALLLLNASIRSGAELLYDYLHLEEKLQQADLLISGEGKTDEQTMYGKAPFFLAQKAKQVDVPVIFISGSLGSGLEQLSTSVDACFSIVPKPATLEESMNKAALWVEDTAYQIGKVLSIQQK
ncbi:glycerate kinase [Bacillus horti]|uniref:Glycerate kinase n=1 Tax=Caldalkalibacillus horti TaxID=77523 RepID=A0ABT9VT44_9BACI|nr:glycerate kinase [Bacillus horti]MDQ0164154.1 glycerate kinase [Bacillus horti]